MSRGKTNFLARFLDGAGDAIDRTLFLFAPRRGARQMQARRRQRFAARMHARMERRIENHLDERLDGAIDAGSSGRLRDKSRWLTSRLAIDADLQVKLGEVRERSMANWLDDTYARGAIEGRVVHVIGLGIHPQSRIPETPRISEMQAKVWRAELEHLARRQFTALGSDGESLWTLEKQAQRLVDLDGEVFAVFSDVGNAEKPLPLQCELVRAERVATPDEHLDDRDVVMGVRKDPTGRAVGYYIWDALPSDPESRWQFVPKVDPKSGRRRVTHVYDKLIPGQTRGLPWMVAAITTLKNVTDYEEIKIIQAQIQACFAAFVKTSGDPEDVAGASASETVGSKRIEDLEPGQINYLGLDEDVEFATPPVPASDYVDYMEKQLRKVAAAINYPYELLAADWQRLTFAGGRLVLIEARAHFQVQQQLIAELFLTPLWGEFVHEAVVLREVSIPPQQYVAAPHLFAEVDWLGTPMPWIDPDTDITAAGREIESGLNTRTKILAARGLDFEEVARELAAERDLLVELGLPTSIPLMNRVEDSTDREAADEAQKQTAGA